MTQLIIEDVRRLTELLFIQDTFDRFLMREAHFVTGITVDLDGTLNPDYFDSDETASLPDSSTVSWKSVRGLCFQIIKGKKLPRRFQIVLKLAPADILSWLGRAGLDNPPETVKGLFITFRYENQQLSCTSGTSLSVFSLDKRLEQAWDKQVQLLLRQMEVACREG